MDTNDDNKLPNYQRDAHLWNIISNNTVKDGRKKNLD